MYRSIWRARDYTLTSVYPVYICERSFFVGHDQRLPTMESTFCACSLSLCLHVHAGEPLLCQSGLDRLEACRPSTTGGWPRETKYDNVASFKKWTPPLFNGPRSYVFNHRWLSTLIILTFPLSAIVTLGRPACQRVWQVSVGFGMKQRCAVSNTHEICAVFQSVFQSNAMLICRNSPNNVVFFTQVYI